MLWKNLKETFNITNKRSIISKARFTMPTESHFNKKTTLATICILITFLSIATGGFGSNNKCCPSKLSARHRRRDLLGSSLYKQNSLA